jgi:type IV secretion system protein VirD4
MWLFLQSLDQLQKCYGESASIIRDNAGLQQYFGITSLDTADHLSRRIGDATILVESINTNISRSRQDALISRGESPGNMTTGEGVTVSLQGKRLLKPEDVILLPGDVGLVFWRNLPVIPVRLVSYLNAREFAKGRTGKGRRLGIGAVILSTAVLLASVLAVSLLTALPSPETLRRAAFAPLPQRMERPAHRRRSSVPRLLIPIR